MNPVDSSLRMMHYNWIPSLNPLESRMYSQYIEASYRSRLNPDEDSEQTGDETHDTMTSATSGERSSSADLFRLEFAASQWSKLVTNAEGLFSKLVASEILPDTEQDQIKQWLCLKQEYEECITSDDGASIPGYQENPRRSLERIEEVTETDERTDESEARMEFRNTSDGSSESETEMSEDDDQSDGESVNPDFLEKLDDCLNKLKLETDRLIDAIDDDVQEMGLTIISGSGHPVNNNNDYVPLIKPTPIRNANSRRNSMLPGSEMCNEVIAFNGAFKPCGKTYEEELDNSRGFGNDNQEAFNSQDLLLEPLKSYEMPEPMKTLKTLTLNNEAKQTQVKKIQSDLDGAQKRIGELETTIKIKEKFIADMIKNSEARSSAKQKFQRKRSKLEEQYYNTRTQLAHAENSLYRDEEKTTHKREIELYKNMAIHYEQRLIDIEMMKQIAGDSAKKVLELESSLNSSKKQMEKLKKQLKKEEVRKSQLEDEVAEDQKKIRELEEKYNLTASKLKEMQSESEDERSNSRYRGEDKKQDMLEVRISHLDHILKEKSMDLERADDVDSKAALRIEIDNLRRTKERLSEEKCNLDSKLKENTLSTFEERKRLECGEAIEVVDVMIEQKNEKICGRKCFDVKNCKREDMEMVLMRQLSMLSLDEIVKLFTKYFNKVIDLKEAGRSLEIQLNDAEARIQSLDIRNRELNNSLKHEKVQAERRMIFLREQHEQKMHMMFRSVADETGSSSYEKHDKDSEIVKYRRENKFLRKRVQDLETLFRGSAVARTTSPPRISQQELKQIGPCAATTKVTRQRNKLIIQKTDCDKRKK
ncbi:kinesin-like protein costa [Fopius arisanus]|uniref:Kinesin-like protein costa n=1 Tax=Fopius arisanus TaxID=64838 RepID=A0A9R1T535_9HYME|nr:PREDICTED: kinesin-like protein costa [Fopius arisanus]